MLSAAGDGATNRGFGNEGLFLKGQKEYEGFLVVKSSAPVTLSVSLAPFGGGTPLASTTLSSKGGNWTEVPFTLTPSASTACEGIAVTDANKLAETRERETYSSPKQPRTSSCQTPKTQEIRVY